MSVWQLQTAKARFSEFLRTVREQGPQVISVHGKEEFVVSLIGDEAGARTRAPKTWDELYAPVEGAGERLVLPLREPESLRALELAESLAEWREE